MAPKEFIEERAVKPTSYFYLRTRWFQPWPSWAKLLGVILWQNKELDLSYEMNNTNRSKNRHWITVGSKDFKEIAIYLQQMEQRDSATSTEFLPGHTGLFKAHLKYRECWDLIGLDGNMWSNPCIEARKANEDFDQIYFLV